MTTTWNESSWKTLKALSRGDRVARVMLHGDDYIVELTPRVGGPDDIRIKTYTTRKAAMQAARRWIDGAA